MRFYLPAGLIALIYSTFCIGISETYAIDQSHSFGTIYKQEGKKNNKRKESKKDGAKITETKQSFGTLLDPTKSGEEKNIPRRSQGFGSLIDQKSTPKQVSKKVPDKEDEKVDLLKSILSTLKTKPDSSKDVAKTETPKENVIKETNLSSKPRLELGFGTGWDYAEGDDSVGNLDITKLSRAYAEAYVRWWGLLDILGPDFGAEAYYFTPTIFRPKICGNSPCSDVLDIRVNYLSANLLYRLARPDLTVTPLVGYLYYNFDIPTSNEFVVDHTFQGVSLGSKIKIPLWGSLQKFSLMGNAFASIGGYSEEGRTTATTGDLLHATALHAELGLRWDYKKGIYFDALWQNDSFWYDFANGSARSSYWNIGGRIAIEFPFVSI